MGGQTALNLAIECGEVGLWEKYDVRLIGVDLEAIELAENREAFRQHMITIGLQCAPAEIANSFLEGMEAAQDHRFSAGHPAQLHAGRIRGRLLF